MFPVVEARRLAPADDLAERIIGRSSSTFSGSGWARRFRKRRRTSTATTAASKNKTSSIEFNDRGAVVGALWLLLCGPKWFRLLVCLTLVMEQKYLSGEVNFGVPRVCTIVRYLL